MTTAEVQRRNQRAQHLKVIQVEDGLYFVESSEGKIAYKVFADNGNRACTCGDYTSNIKRDSEFQCKHILAVQNGNGYICQANLSGNGKKPKLDERFLSNIQGKDFVLYAGLLDLAHQKGLQKIYVEAIQFPSKENGMEAICKAVIESKQHEIYAEWGDANPNNTNRKIAAHILRMAATRAKARALRDFTNIGITCLEELGDFDEAAAEPKPGNGQPPKRVDKKPRKAAEPEPQAETPKVAAPVAPPSNGGGNGTKAEKELPPSSTVKPSPAQMRAIENLAKRRGVNNDQLEEMAQQQFGTSFTNLTATEASGFIRNLQQSA
jgi:hypothetical protein